MGRVAAGHLTNYDFQWTGQSASVWDSVARAPGHLLQSFYLLHFLRWVLPSSGGDMSLLPAHYNQGRSQEQHFIWFLCALNICFH